MSETIDPEAVGTTFSVEKAEKGTPLFRDTGAWFSGCLWPNCMFTSSGWPTEEQAQARGEAHEREHLLMEPMPPKEEVEALTPDVFGSRE